MAGHLAVAGDVFDGILFYAVSSFSHEMSWMKSGTQLSQFLRIVLPTLGLHDQHGQLAREW